MADETSIYSTLEKLNTLMANAQQAVKHTKVKLAFVLGEDMFDALMKDVKCILRGDVTLDMTTKEFTLFDCRIYRVMGSGAVCIREDEIYGLAQDKQQRDEREEREHGKRRL